MAIYQNHFFYTACKHTRWRIGAQSFVDRQAIRTRIILSIRVWIILLCSCSAFMFSSFSCAYVFYATFFCCWLILILFVSRSCYIYCITIFSLPLYGAYLLYKKKKEVHMPYNNIIYFV